MSGRGSSARVAGESLADADARRRLARAWRWWCLAGAAGLAVGSILLRPAFGSNVTRWLIPNLVALAAVLAFVRHNLQWNRRSENGPLLGDLGAGNHMTVLRGVEDIKAYEAGKSNTTSARALAICLKAILDTGQFTDTSRGAMMNILLSQQFTDGIPKGIEAGARNLRVANKTGEITEISHDAAIIQNANGDNYILVILTRGVPTSDQGRRCIAALASVIWDQMIPKP